MMNLNAVTWTLTLLIVGLAKIYSDPSSSWLCSRFTLRGPQVAAPHGAGFNCQTKYLLDLADPGGRCQSADS